MAVVGLSSLAYSIFALKYSQLPLVEPPLIGHSCYQTQIIEERNFCILICCVLPLYCNWTTLLFDYDQMTAKFYEQKCKMY